MPVLGLDLERIGDVLVRLVAGSSMLGHVKPQSTLCYVNPADGPEIEFVRDVLSGMSSRRLAAKWYCGEQGASRLTSFIAWEMLFGGAAEGQAALSDKPGPRLAGAGPRWP